MWNWAESPNVLRNTNTLTAHRARMAAAHRAGMPFLLFPAIFNPAIYIPISGVFLRRHFLPMWAVIAVAVIWICLMVASLIIGFRRRQQFLRVHPQSEFERAAGVVPLAS